MWASHWRSFCWQFHTSCAAASHSVDSRRFGFATCLTRTLMVGIRNMTFLFLVQIWYPHFVLQTVISMFLLLFIHFCNFCGHYFQTFIDPFKRCCHLFCPNRRRLTLKRMKIKRKTVPNVIWICILKWPWYRKRYKATCVFGKVMLSPIVRGEMIQLDERHTFQHPVGWARNYQPVLPSMYCFFLHLIQC